MRIAAYGAVFNFLAVLDGVAASENPPHGELRLTYIDPDGSQLQLNRPESRSFMASGPTRCFPTRRTDPGGAMTKVVGHPWARFREVPEAHAETHG